MLKFELSKLVNNIYKYGICTIVIKIDENHHEEIEIKVTDDKLNVDEDNLLQILSMLYAECFLPEEFQNKKTYLVKDDDSSENKKFEIATLNLYDLIEKMLTYSTPLTDDLDISCYKIYTSTKENLDKPPLAEPKLLFDIGLLSEYMDKTIIPITIIQIIKQRKTLFEIKKIGEEGRRVITIIGELGELKNASNDMIEAVLRKYGYYEIDIQNRKNIDAYLKYIGYNNDKDDEKTK